MRQHSIIILIIFAIIILIIFAILLINCNNNRDKKYYFVKENINVELESPIKITKIAEEEYFFDFGKDAFGSLVVLLNKKINSKVEIICGERLNSSNQIDTVKNETSVVNKVKIFDGFATGENLLEFEDIPVYGKYEINNIENNGTIFPFRYCKVKGIDIKDFTIKRKTYYGKFDDSASYFESSDTVLNQIYRFCKYTIKATGFYGIYVDGDREKCPYEADTYINELSSFAVDKNYDIADTTNDFLLVNPTWPTEWILFTPLLYYQTYMYSGNKTQLEEAYSLLKFKTLESLNKEGLISTTNKENIEIKVFEEIGYQNISNRNPFINRLLTRIDKRFYKNNKTNFLRDIVDWPETERDSFDFKDINTVVNIMHKESLLTMSKIAEALGKTQDARYYAEKADATAKKINALLRNSDGLYVDGKGSQHCSLHSNMFALAFGIVDNQTNIKTVSEFVKSKGMACSVYGAQMLFDGLYNAKEDDYALKLLTDTIGNRNFYNMIRTGSSMALEAWDEQYKPNLDWNHAWGTAALNIIVRKLWGINPVKAGFDEFEIMPQTGNLKFSKIKVPTLKGDIKAEFSISDNKKTYIIEVPDYCKATFVNFENGEKTILGKGKNTIIVSP